MTRKQQGRQARGRVQDRRVQERRVQERRVQDWRVQDGSRNGGLVRFAGVDTHKDTHHVAVVDVEGRVAGDQQFRTDAVGLAGAVAWLRGWGVEVAGVEQCGTYGAELVRRLSEAGIRVLDVNAPDVSVRARCGKSDPIDAVMAAQAVRTGRAGVLAKDRTGGIEALRSLHTARASAVKARTAALTQLDDLAVSVPSTLRDRLGVTNRHIAAASLRLRPDEARLVDPTQAAKVALRSLARRVGDLDTEITRLDQAITTLVTAMAPRLLARPQVGVHIATQLLLTAGQNIDRIGSEAKFARLLGVAPIPASSGKTNRMRLHRGGDRQANRAVHLVAVGRLHNHQPAIDYLHRRLRRGDSKTDAIRAMKRLITRELYGALKADLRALAEL